MAKTLDSKVLRPCNPAKVKRRPDWLLWEQAIHDALDTLHNTGTWTLEHPLPRVKLISSKWVLKVKKETLGRVVRYKAQLVAQRFSQVEGVNNFDTYAHVARLASLIALICMMTFWVASIKGGLLLCSLYRGQHVGDTCGRYMWEIVEDGGKGWGIENGIEREAGSTELSKEDINGRLYDEEGSLGQEYFSLEAHIF